MSNRMNEMITEATSLTLPVKQSHAAFIHMTWEFLFIYLNEVNNELVSMQII